MRHASRLGLVFASLLGLVASTGDADACHNGVELRLDPKAGAVALAERRTGDGAHAHALSLIGAQFGPPASIGKAHGELGERARRIAARAVVRSDGALDPGPVEVREGETARDARLGWALGVARKTAVALPHDPSATGDLGEALARFPAHRAEALRMLEDLEARDVLASGHGYAALARLRLARGEGKAGWASAVLAAHEAPRARVEIRRCAALVADAKACLADPPS